MYALFESHSELVSETAAYANDDILNSAQRAIRFKIKQRLPKLPEPVEVFRVPVRCVRDPVRCIREPARCVLVPVRCVLVPVRCVLAPVRCVRLPVEGFRHLREVPEPVEGVP